MDDEILLQARRDLYFQIALEINKRYRISFEDMVVIARRFLSEQNASDHLAHQKGGPSGQG